MRVRRPPQALRNRARCTLRRTGRSREQCMQCDRSVLLLIIRALVFPNLNRLLALVLVVVVAVRLRCVFV